MLANGVDVVELELRMKRCCITICDSQQINFVQQTTGRPANVETGKSEHQERTGRGCEPVSVLEFESSKSRKQIKDKSGLNLMKTLNRKT